MIPNAKAKIYRFIDDNYVKIVFKSSDDSIVYFEFGDISGILIIKISKLENRFSSFENNLLKYVVL